MISPLVRDTVLHSDYVADIHALRNVEIRSRVSGFVQTIHVDEGKQVSAGQLLFTISDHEYRQEVSKAQAALSSAIAEANAAELDLANVTGLFEKGLVSESELKLTQARLDMLKARVEQERAHVANAELQLSYTQVRAPFGGIINRVPNKAGSLVEDGTLLTTLSDNSEVFAYFNVSEKEYLNMAAEGVIENAMQVTLLLANDEEHQYKGVVETIEGEVDNSTGTIAFRARFPNPSKLLKHGSTGKVQVATPARQAILIPQRSTFEIQEKVYVYIVGDDNRVHLRSFEPVARLPHFYVVKSGLSPTDRFIYEGIQLVKEGDLIETNIVQMESIVATMSAI